MWYGCMIWNGGKSSVEYDSVLFNGVTCYIAVLLRTVLIDKSVPEGSGYKTGRVKYAEMPLHPCDTQWIFFLAGFIVGGQWC